VCPGAADAAGREQAISPARPDRNKEVLNNDV
jgi:hypothetical protein